jgi:Ca2+-binding RTX toxin-like protein
VDSDGSGSIKYDGDTLSGGKQYGDDRVHRDDKKRLYVDIGNGLVIDGNILVKDFQPGNLGINNTGPEEDPPIQAGPEPQPPADPQTNFDITGDLAPLDTNPEEDGVQAASDEWGNTKTNPGEAKPDQADSFNDSPGNDHIDSKGGDDTVNAFRGGDDLIETGKGKDTVDGGAGNDLIKGGEDDDTLKGGIGDDAILGDEGNDKLQGNVGKDTLVGGTGTDILLGGADADRLYADEKATVTDAITAGDNQTGTGLKGDWLSSGVGDDALIGGTGNDVLAGGSGNDLLIGGAGDDDNIAQKALLTQVARLEKAFIANWRAEVSEMLLADGAVRLADGRFEQKPEVTFHYSQSTYSPTASHPSSEYGWMDVSNWIYSSLRVVDVSKEGLNQLGMYGMSLSWLQNEDTYSLQNVHLGGWQIDQSNQDYDQYSTSLVTKSQFFTLPQGVSGFSINNGFNIHFSLTDQPGRYFVTWSEYQKTLDYHRYTEQVTGHAKGISAFPDDGSPQLTAVDLGHQVLAGQALPNQFVVGKESRNFSLARIEGTEGNDQFTIGSWQGEAVQFLHRLFFKVT